MSRLETKRSITDVAKASGVSAATVSRVFNGLGGASDETASRIRLVARRLDYRPRGAKGRPGASGTAGAGTRHLAVVTLGQDPNWLHLPIMASAVGGIRSATEELGYRLILSEVIDAANPGALFQNREIDGAVVFVSSHFTHEIAESLRMLNEQLPVVRVMGGPLASSVDRVLPDNQRIGELAHAYLKECGCREVGYVTTSPGWSLMRIRGHAFLDAACDAGRPGRAFLLTPEPNVEWSYGRNVTAAQDVPGLVAKLAAAKPRLDGLFFANDRTTTEFFPLLVRAGMRPGHDLTIVSCDNEEVRLAALDPRPASIDIHAHEIGRRAVMQVIARIARPSDPPLCIYISPSLVRAGR